MTDGADRQLSDLGRDKAYFSLVNDLVIQHKSRYEQQAKRLLLDRQLTTTVNETPVKYKLEFRGCSFEVYFEESKEYEQVSWVRMGWRNSDKLSRLPLFFARTEAKLLFKN